ncbi:hypothetical protein TDSAC_1506 [Thermodesulfobium acidiphilum]|uniref:Uncharacterized protein n=1 Tax=Thermodesulfobium acidiphilum TaxID=1794699 RepID=A0A2R4W254_THEAF|nr:hypothetical protein [Thermodesulfobium acidiphilum]AWB10845.1 hypothetical protein TDSAC_1506 [Thermodesulfobium acidiphilum]PMP86296.1 MAG: hypothetical protein C0174_01900 [Thermodesulfobium narugense]
MKLKEALILYLPAILFSFIGILLGSLPFCKFLTEQNLLTQSVTFNNITNNSTIASIIKIQNTNLSFISEIIYFSAAFGTLFWLVKPAKKLSKVVCGFLSVVLLASYFVFSFTVGIVARAQSMVVQFQWGFFVILAFIVVVNSYYMFYFLNAILPGKTKN